MFEICALLGYYAALSGSSVPTFLDNLSVGPIGCPESSVQNYHSTLRNIPEDHRSHLHRGGSLNSRVKACSALCFSSVWIVDSNATADFDVLCV